MPFYLAANCADTREQDVLCIQLAGAWGRFKKKKANICASLICCLNIKQASVSVNHTEIYWEISSCLLTSQMRYNYTIGSSSHQTEYNTCSPTVAFHVNKYMNNWSCSTVLICGYRTFLLQATGWTLTNDTGGREMNACRAHVLHHLLWDCMTGQLL